MAHKKSSWLRKGALYPALVVILAVTLYVHFLFDLHLKQLLSSSLTSLNGAQVNVGALHTSFFKGQLQIKKVEVGNPKEPMRNRIELDLFDFQLLPLELIKLKFIMPQVEISGLHYNTQRETSCELPPQHPSLRQSSWLSKLSGEVAAQMYGLLSEKVQNNPLGFLSTLAEGLNVEKAIESVRTLESQKAVKKAQAAVKGFVTTAQNLESTLQESIAPRALKTRIENLLNASPKTPTDIARTVSDVQSTVNEVQKSTQAASALQNKVMQQAMEVETEINRIPQGVEQDVEQIKSQLQLPSLKAEDISRHLFAPQAIAQFEMISKWVAVVRQLMPKKSSEQTPIKRVEIPRRRGTDFWFGRAHSFPQFLIENLTLQSDVSSDKNQGEVQGKLTGLTENPSLYGKPMQALFEGHFPQSRIEGVRLQSTIDHTTEVFRESVDFSIKSLPVASWVLSDTDDLQLALAKGMGSGSMTLEFVGSQMKGRIYAKVHQSQFKLSMQAKRIEQILERVLAKVGDFDLEISLSGSPESPVLFVKSSLGEKLSESLTAEFKHQIGAIETNVRKKVEQAVSAQQTQLMSQFERERKKLLAPLEAKLSELKSLEKELQKKVETLEKQTVGKATEKLLKKPLENLKKKLPF